MRVETRSVQNTTTVYIAEDGTEFYRECDCASYERKCERLEVMGRVEALPNFCGAPPHESDNMDWQWFYVKNKEEVDDIIKAFYEPDCTADDFQPDKFPCWIAAITDSDNKGYGTMITYSEYAAAQKVYEEKIAEEMQRLTPVQIGG